MINFNTEKELKELDTFKGIKAKTFEEIRCCGQIREYRKGKNIFIDKEDVTMIYIVLSGKFSLYKLGNNGQKRVVYILGKDRIINEVIIDDLPSSINCEVFESGKLLLIEKNKLISLMEEDFNLTKNTIESLSKKVRRLYRQIKNTSPNILVDKKLAAKLWKLSKDYGEKTDLGVEINLNLSKTYLADMFGSQRETISRTLKELEKKNLIIVKNKRITILNSEKLIEFFKKS